MIGPTFRLEYNTYDDLHLPNRGTSFAVAASYASRRLASTRDFLRLEASARRYVAVTDRFLIVPGFDLGACIGEPTWDRFFRTGGRDLAGFDHDYFTTEDRTLLHLGLEYRILNLLQREDYPLYLQLRSNVATFEPLDRMISDGDPWSNMHWGVGLGLRTNSPLGPLSIMIGAADIKRHDLANLRLSYSISVGREFRY